MDSIKFFTSGKSGCFATFEIETEIFGWKHVFQGSIIDSLSKGRMCVVYPKGDMRHFPHTPKTPLDTKEAEVFILNTFREWYQMQRAA